MREDVGKPCERMWGSDAGGCGERCGMLVELAIGLIIVDLSKERWLSRTNRGLKTTLLFISIILLRKVRTTSIESSHQLDSTKSPNLLAQDSLLCSYVFLFSSSQSSSIHVPPLCEHFTPRD